MSAFIDVPGGRLNVAEEGNGPPVVLLHAGMADLRSWNAFAPLLAGSGYRVVRFDGRGFGRTVTEDVEFSNRADVAAILDALGLRRTALVGSSRGGSIAVDTAIEFPDRVVAVVGVAGGLGGFRYPDTDVERPLLAAFERLEEESPPDLEALADLAVQIWVDGPGQPSGRVPTAASDVVREMVRSIWGEGMIRGRPLPLRPPANDRLDELRCPILAIAAEYDTASTKAVAARLEAAAPDGRAVLMQGVGHMIGMEAPGELASIVAEFLRPLGRWS